MTMKTKIFFLLSIFLNLTFAINGQTKSKEETFLGIGSGSRKIAKSTKRAIIPLHVDSTMEMEEIKYYLEPKQQQVTYEIENIKPARLKVVEPLEKLYSGYVKAAAGSYLTPLLNFNYSSLRSKYDSWGIKGDFQSSFGNIKEMGNTNFTDLGIGGYFQKFFNDHDLWAEIDYKKNSFNFYGLDYSDTLLNLLKDRENIFNQNYDLFDAHVKFNSKNNGRDTNKLRYQTWLNLHRLSSRYQMVENYLLLGAHSGWVIMDEEFLGTFELDINNLSQPSLSLDTNDVIVSENQVPNTTAVIRFNPHIYTRKNNLIAKVGVSLQANINDKSNFKFFPDVEVSYSLFNNVFIPYGGLKGNIERNTFNNLRNQNPYLSEDSEILNTINRVNLFFGVRGSMSNNFTFNISTKFEKFDDFCLFTPDTISSFENKFKVTYDKLDRAVIAGEITYQQDEKLKIFSKLELFNYSTSNEKYAWQRPNSILTFGSVLDLADKITVKGDVFFIGSRNVYSYNMPSENKNIRTNENGNIIFDYSNSRYIYELKPFIDMNLSVEYRYNKKVSAFIQFNNFTARKYQFWTNFPVQSINIMGGVNLSF